MFVFIIMLNSLLSWFWPCNHNVGIHVSAWISPVSYSCFCWLLIIWRLFVTRWYSACWLEHYAFFTLPVCKTEYWLCSSMAACQISFWCCLFLFLSMNLVLKTFYSQDLPWLCRCQECWWATWQMQFAPALWRLCGSGCTVSEVLPEEERKWHRGGEDDERYRKNCVGTTD